MEWINSLIERLTEGGSGIGAGWLALIALVTIAVVIGIALLVAGPVRRRRAGEKSATLFGDDTRSADEFRRSAQLLAESGQWSAAVLDRFRAIIRALEQRAILDVSPGRTADEAARSAAQRFPALDEELVDCGRIFDEVYYGEHQVEAATFARILDLDERLMATTPTLPVGLPVGPGLDMNEEVDA